MVALRMKRPKGRAVTEFTWNQSTGPEDAKSTQHSQGRASEEAGDGMNARPRSDEVKATACLRLGWGLR